MKISVRLAWTIHSMQGAKNFDIFCCERGKSHIDARTGGDARTGPWLYVGQRTPKTVFLWEILTRTPDLQANLIGCGAWRKPLHYRHAHPSSESAKPHNQRSWWDVHLTCSKLSYHADRPSPKERIRVARSYVVKEKNYTNVWSMTLSLSVTLTLRMQILSSSWKLQGHSTS